jgi:hypothetical protein
MLVMDETVTIAGVNYATNPKYVASGDFPDSRWTEGERDYAEFEIPFSAMPNEPSKAVPIIDKHGKTYFIQHIQPCSNRWILSCKLTS